jgi:anti-anti-sigma factor
MSTPARQSAHGVTIGTRQAGPDTVVVHISGEIDMVSAPAFAQGIDDALADAARVVLDLTEVTFMSSAGITVLLTRTADAADRRIRLPIVADGAPVIRPLQLTGLDAQLDLHTTLADALED